MGYEYEQVRRYPPYTECREGESGSTFIIFIIIDSLLIQSVMAINKSFIFLSQSLKYNLVQVKRQRCLLSGVPGPFMDRQQH